MRRNLLFALVVLLAIGALVYRTVAGGSGAKIKNSPAPATNVVAYGDSLAHDALPSWSSALDAPVLDLTKAGETTQSAKDRLEALTSAKPTIALITLGTEDLARKTPLEETVPALRDVFRGATGAGALVAYVAVVPQGVGDNWALALKDLCRAEGVLWIDGPSAVASALAPHLKRD